MLKRAQAPTSRFLIAIQKQFNGDRSVAKIHAKPAVRYKL